MASLELTVRPGWPRIQRSACFYLLSAGIKDVHHPTWQTKKPISLKKKILHLLFKVTENFPWETVLCGLNLAQFPINTHFLNIRFYLGLWYRPRTSRENSGQNSSSCKHGKGVSSFKCHCVEVCALLVCLSRERQESCEGWQWRHTDGKGKLSYTKILPKAGIAPTAAASRQNDSPRGVRSPHPVFLLLKDELLNPTARPCFLSFTSPYTGSFQRHVHRSQETKQTTAQHTQGRRGWSASPHGSRGRVSF